jgi:HK97 family phage prohead protease
MANQIEFRTFKAELRASADKPLIEGYAAVYNTVTDLGGGYREKINPSAFTRALTEKQDTRCLFNHDANHVLGRVKNGTLRMTSDNTGLHYECDVNEADPQAVSARAKILRGDVDQCSFAFICTKDSVVYNDDGTMERELLDVELLDVSPVTYPAYESTSCEARSVDSARASAVAARDAARKTEQNLTPDQIETLRLRLKVRSMDECQCDCPECEDGDCSECSNENCVDKNCK